jgi:HEPN domain-containing protein
MKNQGIPEFKDCIVRKTIPGSNHCAWGTSDALDWPGPIYEFTFYLCQHKHSSNFYLLYTYDRFERGAWEETQESGGIQVSKQLAEVIAEEKNVTEPFVTLGGLLEGFNETSQKLESCLMCSPFYADLRHDLSELNSCLKAGAFRASLAMSGRILEMCLKIRLIRLGIEIQKDWMIGKLLSLLEASDDYLDPALKNVWNVINQQRIIGVHSKEMVPIPSKNQACMVAHAVLDVLDRTARELPT